jgi:hypothetical protein
MEEITKEEKNELIELNNKMSNSALHGFKGLNRKERKRRKFLLAKLEKSIV